MYVIPGITKPRKHIDKNTVGTPIQEYPVTRRNMRSKLQSLIFCTGHYVAFSAAGHELTALNSGALQWGYPLYVDKDVDNDVDKRCR